MLLSVFSATCWSGTRGGNEKEIEKAGFSLPVGPCDAGLKLSFLRKEKEKEKAACWSVRRGPEAQLFQTRKRKENKKEKEKEKEKEKAACWSVPRVPRAQLFQTRKSKEKEKGKKKKKESYLLVCATRSSSSALSAFAARAFTFFLKKNLLLSTTLRSKPGTYFTTYFTTSLRHMRERFLFTPRHRAEHAHIYMLICNYA